MVNMRMVAATAMLAAALIGALALAAATAGAQAGDEAVIRVIQPAQTEFKKGDVIAVDIDIDNAQNLGSFGFDLLFNADVLRAVDPERGEGDFVTKGDFLGSTRRDVVCNPVADSGVVRVRCVSLGPTPPGPNGGGRLATVTLKAVGSGTSELRVDNLQVVKVSEHADVQPARGENISIRVKGDGGMNWLLWGPVIAIGALAVAGAAAFGAMRLRSGGAGSPAAWRV
jgi:hypothetical protein